jgi:hypothetical protein
MENRKTEPNKLPALLTHGQRGNKKGKQPRPTNTNSGQLQASNVTYNLPGPKTIHKTSTEEPSISLDSISNSKPSPHPTIAFKLKEPFAKMVLFLAFQMDQRVACHIIKKPWRALLFLAAPLNILKRTFKL